jgi:monovalent cation:H+ antiporter, CPA1 family
VLYLVTFVFHINLPIIYCFLFGSIISPTDPIAVGAILKTSKIPPRLNTIISGESLFNDGIGLILFVIILGITQKPGEGSLAEILKIFAQEILGGIIIGLVLGFLSYELIKTIHGFQTIFLISIALVLAISVVASKFHCSIPLAAVTAGLIVRNKSTGKSNIADQSLVKVWQLVSEVLNTILFVMIGLQMVIMPFLHEYWVVGLISIIVLLISRLVSIAIPAVVLLHRFNTGNLSILTWAGLRGGISIAMALTLPPSPHRELILASCYFVVIFSIIFQGLTLRKVVDIGIYFKAG